MKVRNSIHFDKTNRWRGELLHDRVPARIGTQFYNIRGLQNFENNIRANTIAPANDIDNLKIKL